MALLTASPEYFIVLGRNSVDSTLSGRWGARTMQTLFINLAEIGHYDFLKPVIFLFLSASCFLFPWYMVFNMFILNAIPYGGDHTFC